jgi:hypothetical protein
LTLVMGNMRKAVLIRLITRDLCFTR